jgi:PAP2 superfamily
MQTPGPTQSRAIPWRQIRWLLTVAYLRATLAITNRLQGDGSRYKALGDALGQIPTDREIIVGWMVGLIVVTLVGRTFRDLRVTLLSWAPFAAALFFYDFARSIGFRIHGGSNAEPMVVIPQLRIDEWLGFGRLPTTILQERFFNPDRIYAYDVAVSAVYTSHFMVPYLFAGYLWARGQRLWRWYAGMFVAINFSACAIFAAVTTAPPWYAANEGLIPPFERIIAGRGWSRIGLNLMARVIDKGQDTVNPYAAIPSLHSAQALLIVACLWPLVWKWVRPFLLAYPLFMTFALVYSGEHYLIDIFAGWGLVALALTGGWWLRQRFGWVSPFIEPRLASSSATEATQLELPTLEPTRESGLGVRA